MKELIAGLDRMRNAALDGARDGMKGPAAGVTFDMRDSPAHGDQTGASHANYAAYVVGRGETGALAVAASITAVETLNPGHVARGHVSIETELGVVITSFTDYQDKLETENAGAKAVLTPTVAQSGARFTRAAANGSKKALHG